MKIRDVETGPGMRRDSVHSAVRRYLTIVSPPDGGGYPPRLWPSKRKRQRPEHVFEIAVDGPAQRHSLRADSAGHVEAVIRVERGSHVFRIAGEELHIVANPPAIPAHAEAPGSCSARATLYFRGLSKVFRNLYYNPRYTHAAIYLGPGRDGAALIAEAVVNNTPPAWARSRPPSNRRCHGARGKPSASPSARRTVACRAERRHRFHPRRRQSRPEVLVPVLKVVVPVRPSGSNGTSAATAH